LNQDSIFYGINTGFGSLVTEHIDSDLLKELQKNIILSHSSGVGKPFEKDVVRAMMVCLVGSLSRGLSGIRPIILDNLIVLLNNDAIPIIPSIGSVGASGDLCPLAHCSLALIGEGFINFKNKTMPSKEVLNILGIKKTALKHKVR
jgi:histidine ammonia-lyase